MARKIMYIGNKPRKSDNVNNMPHRVWQGLGDVIEVTDFEASKINDPQWSNIWRDVTDLNDSEREALVKSFDEQYEAVRRKDAAANKVHARLDLASPDELRAELEKRLGRRVVEQLAEEDAPNPRLRRTGGALSNSTKDASVEKERPKKTEVVLVDIAQAIGKLDREDPGHFDSEGNPNLEIVTHHVGYRISKSELDHAVKTIKE